MKLKGIFASILSISCTVCLLIIPASALIGQIDLDLSSPSFEPKVLSEAALQEKGQFSFKLNKPVNSDIPVHGFKMKIELSNIQPIDGSNSVGGNAAELFSWEYDKELNTLIGTQKKQIIGFLYSGEILVDFVVTGNSTRKEPRNGFQVSIYDTLDKYDLIKKNNMLSNYTWTNLTIKP